jgi:cyclic beta-1,2-glucan synthetase
MDGQPEAIYGQIDEGALSDIRSQAVELMEQAEDVLSKAHELAAGVNMRFLYDRQRRLFSIGFNVSAGSLDGSFYDLLASEARLGSFVAIARGDVPYEHWLAMGRPFGSVNGRRALLSWSGTMFEYLMPNLLQRGFSNSLLDMASKAAVAAQQEYARSRGVPWGMSESAFGDLDLNKTYQYQAFGVPGLGMKRGLEQDLVVAPYATVLALAVDPGAAMENLDRLAAYDLGDGYGFFEAIDFSRQRRREGARGVLVRAYMAHHQGMSFLALDNLIHDGVMRDRFHADPRVKAAEPLLYERIPVAPPLHHVSSREALPSRVSETGIAPSVSKFDTPHSPTPRVQLLSNRSYSLAVTSAGGGYSRWRELDLTRWRADTTRDPWGVFCYIRDLDSGEVWSNTHHPVGRYAEEFAVNFAVDRAEFKRLDEGIETETEIVVSPEDDAEIRRVTLTNRTGRRRRLEITSYVELAMAPHAADRQHPAFQKIFVQTKSVPMQGTLYAHRRPRHPDEEPIYVAHRLTFEGDYSWAMQFETDRRQFIGRGRTVANPIALERELSNSEGFVLDPIFSLRRAVTLEPNSRIQVSLVLGAGDSRASVLAISEKYSDPKAIDRALELAWVNTQLELRSLRFHPDDARRFQKLASHMLYPSSPLRPPGERLAQNRLGQERLWPYGISGDLPMAAVTIGEASDIGLVRQLLQAHTYWRVHGLTADLLILNEESSSYEGVLNEQLKKLVQAHSMFTGIDLPGGVFLRSVDQLPEEDLTLMLTAANISLVAARGPLAQQLGGLGEPVELPDELRTKKIKEQPSAALPHVQLTHANGLGGFTPDGREYVITLGAEDQTPAPWVNVMANPEFGALVSESGSGFAWYGNSQRNRLIGWSNDPVSDPPSDAIYIRDMETGGFWTPTPLPIRENEPYRIRHGAGYSVFEHNSHAIEQQLTVFVPVDGDGGEPVRLQRLRLKNDQSRRCRLSVTFYVEWALGEDRETSQMHVVTRWDEENRVLMARNRYHPDYGDRIAFAALSPSSEIYSADRIEFLGRNGDFQRPAAMSRERLSGRTGAGLDPCGALQVELELEPGEETEITCMLGQAGSPDEIQRLVRKYREPLAVDESLSVTRAWWDDLLGKIQVELPDEAATHMLNRWLLYQDLSCRIWGRSGLYQSGGAFGFRDQLQDMMALVYAAPQLAREHILRAAGRQFREGDVQHWWHPPSGAGVRTRISDDLLWLPYVTAHYVRTTGDEDILNEQVPFIEARELEDDEREAFLIPEPSGERATLYEHCCRALERGNTSGPRGLPLIGAGDWNDGLNRVGEQGRGESVWLAWFLLETFNRFAELAERHGQPGEADSYRAKAEALVAAIEREAWDGDWYRRAYYDDGTPLGSAESEEARIDSLPQSWAALSGAGDPERIDRALESAWENLVREDDQLVQLFDPPFDKTEMDPGYIKGYPPGVRENGGQYTHGSLWLAMAFARQGEGERAVKLLRLMNPVEHALDPEGVERYRVEPYAVAADVYCLPGRIGQGGWTWYTGSAGWMYRAWVEEILGFTLRGDELTLNPVIPTSWPGFKLRYCHGEAIYDIEVNNPDGVGQGVAWVELDGRRLEDLVIPLESAAIKHKVLVRMGDK